ncbi:MAG TPA: hypothetical protein VGG05_21910 [Pseudonocardiaceae bacterium]|jgi:alanine-glyoxylate transaminase/serine-glyoxylate transaminase/serine-pyruvate transaminase
MPLLDRTLLGSGPSNPYPEATQALAAPLLGHLDPDFLGILDETCDRLRTVWGTANRRTLPLSGTGSIGMEAAFANTVAPGAVVVVAVHAETSTGAVSDIAALAAAVHERDPEALVLATATAAAPTTTRHRWP